MVTIIQRARVYIGRRERRKKGISLPVDTQASEGGGGGRAKWLAFR